MDKLVELRVWTACLLVVICFGISYVLFKKV